MNRSRALALLVVAATLWLAMAAWERVAPALNEGWLGSGMAARVFMPLVFLIWLAVWLWRR